MLFLMTQDERNALAILIQNEDNQHTEREHPLSALALYTQQHPGPIQFTPYSQPVLVDHGGWVTHPPAQASGISSLHRKQCWSQHQSHRRHCKQSWSQTQQKHQQKHQQKLWLGCRCRTCHRHHHRPQLIDQP